MHACKNNSTLWLVLVHHLHHRTRYEHSVSSIAVKAKCRTVAQRCREELFEAQRVLGNLGQVAKSVLQRQPDLQLGIQEKSTEMCQAFFGDFDSWVKEMKVCVCVACVFVFACLVCFIVCLFLRASACARV